MRYSQVLVVAAAAGLASAQLPNIEPCAFNCFATTLPNDGCAQLTDFKCHCEKKESFGTIIECVQKACPADKLESVRNTVLDVCKKAGVPITLPEIPGSGSSSAALSSAAPSSAAPSSAAPSSAAPSSAAPSSAAPSSAAPSSAAPSSAAPTSEGGAPVPTGTGSVPSHSGSYTAPTKPSAPATFTGAAAGNGASFGGIAAALLGLAALF